MGGEVGLTPVGRLLANNRAGSVIATGIGVYDIAITVRAGDGSLFASPSGTNYSILVITDSETGREFEFVRLYNVTDDIFSVERGFLGSTRKAWSAGALIRDAVTSGLLDAMYAEFDCVERHIAALEAWRLTVIDWMAAIDAWQASINGKLTTKTVRNVTAARAAAVDYTNTSGNEMFVTIICGFYTGGTDCGIFVGDILVSSFTSAYSDAVTVSATVPDGAIYSLIQPYGTLDSWIEVSI